MERTDRELILRALRRDIRLKRLYDEHCKLEEELSRFQKRAYLTQDEASKEKQLKRKKLAGVDEMMSIVSGMSAAA